MRIIVQRCIKAQVTVNNRVEGIIGNGLVLFVGFTHSDSINEIEYLVDKVINLRIFNDENGIMNKSLKEVNGTVLSISQFTLYADTSKGRRPNYLQSLDGGEASKLYNLFNDTLKKAGINVETGIFGAEMQVDLINDGPVTIILERNDKNEKK